ncbi:hypothetical protein ITI46_20615 [Streptomyces oryzae]|uniref:Histone protein n=1 Tax=Streptomyces oryzae TaxID=1434886 RepID=A0ABS3XFD3_9ACTN|nr:hypothetical protein [Streptomyces oryzae]MBO8194048.1 hypothetical protein [Streptomyces oryzae]
MTDSCKTAVLAAVAGGYFLGRTRKAKLALTLGSVVAGRRLGLDPQELLRTGVRKIAETPQFEELTDQIKHQLMAAARTAVSSAANRRLETLADSLRERTDRLGGGEEEGEGEGEGESKGKGPDEETGPDEGKASGEEKGSGQGAGESRKQADREGAGRGSGEGREAREGRGEGKRKTPSRAHSSADGKRRKPAERAGAGAAGGGRRG